MNENYQFTDDIAVPGCLYALVLRSPVARGALKWVEAPPLPRKHFLVKAADIPGENVLRGHSEGGQTKCAVPVLASQALSYIGEPVALLAGPDETDLLALAAQCRVSAEEQKPFFNAESAPESALERKIILGDAGDVFEKAEAVIEDYYATGFQDAWGADPAGAVAIPVMDSGGGKKPAGMTICTATQWPYHVKESVAAVLGLSPDAVEVKPSRLEWHLDGKILYPSLCACHAAVAAWVSGKPVKLILGRIEDFRYAPKRVKTAIGLRSAISKEGRILGTELTATVDMGAAGFFAAEILDRVLLGAAGAYRHPALAINARAVITDIPPAGPLAGFGMAQGFFAAERHAAKIADQFRDDPAEWRKNNFVQKGFSLPIGCDIKEQPTLDELIDSVSSMSDYRRKWAAFELLRQDRRAQGVKPENGSEPLRGIGIACAYQGNGLLYPPGGKRQGVELTLGKDGTLEIRTSMMSLGEEQLYPWKSIAARCLGVDENLVRIVNEGGDIPDSGPACLSRNITLITRLVERSCEAIKKQRFRAPLPITVRRFYSPATAKAWGGENALFDAGALSSLSWGVAVVEVEVDMAELAPCVRGVWLAIDGGPILTERRARKSLTLYSLQALNWAMREVVSYEEGIIPLGQMGRYTLPLSEEAPPVKIDFRWSEGASKGIGELPFCTVPAAFAQAVSQALDHHFARIPIGPAEIWELLQSRREEKPA